MYRSHYSKEVTQKDYDKQVTVAGWIEDIRRDGKGTLQITVLKKKTPELFEQLTSFSRESVISVKGLCKENEKVRNGYEILPEEVEILSAAETPLPLGVVDKVEADFDTRLHS